MYLKSLKVTDYSTGDSYSYGDKSGSWQSIVAENGEVEGNDSSEPKSTVSAPAVTATVDSIPIPWEGTHRQTSSFVTPNIWPWVATPTASTSETSLPDWAYSGSGSARPPSTSSVSEHCPILGHVWLIMCANSLSVYGPVYVCVIGFIVGAIIPLWQ